MKITLLFAIVFMVAIIFGFSGKASAQVTFVVSNQQPEGLGQVMISTDGGNNYLTVPGNTTDTVSIADTATSIMIFGQIVPQGQQAYITLPDQTVVAVMWETQCEVVVVDKDEIN
jgi:hypothetical protein